MKRLGWTIVALACAGCTPPAAENEAVRNEVANTVTVEEKAPEPAPTPTANAVALPDNVTAEAAAGANGLPADVQKFIERREGCEHWAGEPDFDAERRKQIEQAVAELCPGIDTQLAALRKAHAKDPAVIAALKDFEPLGMDD
jgi:hypothetical protein